MPKQWTKNEIAQFLTNASPFVRLFFKKMLKKRKGSISELKVPATSVAMSMRVFNGLGKKPLFEVDKSEKSPKYSIDKAHKKAIANFFSTFKEARMAKKKARKKKVVRKKATSTKRGRRPGRPKRAAGVISIPEKYSEDFGFWVNFVQTVNATKGKRLVITTDGKDISLKVE